MFGVGVTPPAGVDGEFGTVSLRIAGKEIDTWKAYRVSSHFLTKTDSFQFELGHERLDESIRALIKGGSKVELLIGDAKQMTGYIDAVRISGDRGSGVVISVDGRDSMSPVVDSQINPAHHYPDKTSLEQLVREIYAPFGFTRFLVDNEDNVDVAANRALKQHAGKAKGRRRRTRRHTAAPKALKQYSLPKSKPEHNDSYFDFLSRITQRLGLWMWPTVDGEGVVVGKPNYDQESSGQIRHMFDGSGNVLRGEIARDASEQPSFIVASGNVPGRSVQGVRTKVVIGNPYDDVVGRVLKVRPREESEDGETLRKTSETGSFNSLTPRSDDIARRLLGAEASTSTNSSLTAASESGTFNSFAETRRVKTETYTKVLPSRPIELANPFAGDVAKPRFLRDKASRTIEELERFARRQMSLCTRRAFVAKYTIMGHTLNGVVPQVDTIVDVVDEPGGFEGRLWVVGRTFQQSRGGGTTTELELIPINALQF